MMDGCVCTPPGAGAELGRSGTGRSGPTCFYRAAPSLSRSWRSSPSPGTWLRSPSAAALGMQQPSHVSPGWPGLEVTIWNQSHSGFAWLRKPWHSHRCGCQLPPGLFQNNGTEMDWERFPQRLSVPPSDS